LVANSPFYSACLIQRLNPRLDSQASRVCARGTHSGMQKQLEPIDLAKCVESSLHSSLDGFDLPRARLYGVSIVDADGVRSNHNGALRISFLAEHGDVYELLDAPSSAIARMFDAAVVLTCGWAAPIDRDESPADEDSSEVPPSQHPQRRRVRLVVSVCDNGVASVLRFADTPDDIVTDAGSARGSLADAVNNLWRDPKVVVSRETIE
ncbi:MAG: hypothetical protein ACO384_06685, partial [Ilumatobacteraceae bacterium]